MDAPFVWNGFSLLPTARADCIRDYIHLCPVVTPTPARFARSLPKRVRAAFYGRRGLLTHPPLDRPGPPLDCLGRVPSHRKPGPGSTQKRPIAQTRSLAPCGSPPRLVQEPKALRTDREYSPGRVRATARWGRTCMCARFRRRGRVSSLIDTVRLTQTSSCQPHIRRFSIRTRSTPS